MKEEQIVQSTSDRLAAGLSREAAERLHSQVGPNEIAPASLLAVVAVGALSVALAPLLSTRRIQRMDVPSTLRVMS